MSCGMPLPRLAAKAGLLACVATLCGAGDVTAPADPPVLVAFGDSTTAPRRGVVPYVEVLGRRLAQSGHPALVAVNAGVRGDTTVRARERFGRDVLAREPDLVIVQFGINDSAIDVWKTPPATGPRTPLEVFEDNLVFFVTELRRRGAEVVLMTPNALAWTPVLRKQYGKPPYDPDHPDGFSRPLVPYAEAVRRVAAAHKVRLVDVFALHVEIARMPGPSLLLDGIHPNQAGHDLVAEKLLRLIEADAGLLRAGNPVRPMP